MSVVYAILYLYCALATVCIDKILTKSKEMIMEFDPLRNGSSSRDQHGAVCR
jgi:hypothetical protein